MNSKVYFQQCRQIVKRKGNERTSVKNEFKIEELLEPPPKE